MTLDVFEYLMFRSYAYQRARNPDVEPERWGKLYLNWKYYEKLYQQGEKDEFTNS